MSWWGWLTRRKGTAADSRLTEWRARWDTAASAPDRAAADDLRRALDAMALPEEDVEIEREMLDGLEAVASLAESVGSNGLPVVSTGHRVVGRDVCHFTASVSMPDDTAQASGRLILTSARAIFVGGARAVTVAWHMIGETRQAGRDLVLIRVDRQTLYRYRCNSFSDAMCAAFLAKRLANR
jgi:hypothetical protein